MDKLIELEVDEMSKIKFRVCDKVNNIMLQLDNENKEELIDLFENAVDLMGLGFQYYPNTEWMLSTGLKDKNGKEIYEKDIVKYKDYGEEHISKVIQDLRLGTGHYIKSPGIGFYSINESTINTLEIEVIGNVFEDSHLLEEQHG